jgi:hypothetical protein
MKTIELNIYSFNELSTEAKQTVIENYKSNGLNTDGIYHDAIETVKKAIDLFNIKTTNSWFEANLNNIDDNIMQLKGLRLRKWFLNNFGSELYKRKFYTSIGDNKIINHPCIKINIYDTNKGARVSSSNFYYSRIQKDNCCVLTGVCYDDDFLQPIYELIEFKNKNLKNTTFEDVINDCFYSLDKSVQNEVDYNYTDEAIIEHIEANEYSFLENGEQY